MSKIPPPVSTSRSSRNGLLFSLLSFGGLRAKDSSINVVVEKEERVFLLWLLSHRLAYNNDSSVVDGFTIFVVTFGRVEYSIKKEIISTSSFPNRQFTLFLKKHAAICITIEAHN